MGHRGCVPFGTQGVCPIWDTCPIDCLIPNLSTLFSHLYSLSSRLSIVTMCPKWDTGGVSHGFGGTNNPLIGEST